MNDLEQLVSKRNRERRFLDEPWGTSLVSVLWIKEPDLLAMLNDEGLNPEGYHAGSERYAAAWARLRFVIAEELKLVAEAAARDREYQKYIHSPVHLSHEALSLPEELDLIPLPKE